MARSEGAVSAGAPAAIYLPAHSAVFGSPFPARTALPAAITAARSPPPQRPAVSSNPHISTSR